MAKIGSLEIDTIKIAGNALTNFFSPSGSSITVDNPFLIPVIIWIGSNPGPTSLTRGSDSLQIGSVGGVGARGFGMDAEPIDTDEVYTVSGSGASIHGAMVMLK